MSLLTLNAEHIAILLQLVLNIIGIYGFIKLYKITKWVGWLYFTSAIFLIIMRVSFIFLHVVQDLDIIYNSMSIVSDLFILLGIYTMISVVRKAYESGSVLNILAYNDNLEVTAEKLRISQDKVDSANKDLELARTALKKARLLLSEILKNKNSPKD